ncbi:LOW QUALITY PROTEIN: hypothetical protein CsSME_00028648 [Camellia sinensis var. sinensis]
MEEIQFVSTSTVQPTSESTDKRIELTPWDLQLLLLGPIQKGLLFLKPTPSQQQQLLANTIVDHLKISFSRTLDFFPILAGRLHVVKNDDDTFSFFVDCNNAGAHFVHAVAENVNVSDILVCTCLELSAFFSYSIMSLTMKVFPNHSLRFK